MRAVIKWFGMRMENKLKENDHKGGWMNCNFKSLFKRMRIESDEILEAYYFQRMQRDWGNWKIDEDSAQELIDECADVANYAMMIADNCKKRIDKAQCGEEL